MNYYAITEFIFIKLNQLIMHNTELHKVLGFSLNQQQKEVIDLLEDFSEKNNDNDVFILKGSAGTGKTSIVKALKHILQKKFIQMKICAPTARASSIISSKTSHCSKTIHSEIYIPNPLDGGGVEMLRRDNQSDLYSIYVIDESSMISNKMSSSIDFVVSRPLLEELIDYVKQGNPRNKIVFIGDKFQLPPVNEIVSPALDIDFLSQEFKLKAKQFELTEVMRQKEDCKVLQLATQVRDSMINQKDKNDYLDIDRYHYSMGGLNQYLNLYNKDKIDSVIMICGANKNVETWNRLIRSNLGFNNPFLNVGEFVMMQENWIGKGGRSILKGEFGKVININDRIQEYAGLHFVDVEIEFLSCSGTKKISSKILLEAINTRYGKLTSDKEKTFYAHVMKNNKTFRRTLKRSDDKYLGAMRLKHAYAITCHKAQGGEWDNVFIHPWKLGIDLSWTYTALTRARKHVFSYAA
jgi:exodeoxyribonuclease V